MSLFAGFAIQIINLYTYVVMAWAILGALTYFDIVNRRNPFVAKLDYALFRLVDPVLKPIRRWMPDLGGVDISPIILILLLNFLIQLLGRYF